MKGTNNFGLHRIVSWAKQTDAHLRTLETRISDAEAHRLVLQQRMKDSASEGDLNSLVASMQGNTSELLACYREHKIKADTMLLAVLGVCGGSVLTLAGSILSHWRAQREHEDLSKRLNADLSSMIESKLNPLMESMREERREMLQLQVAAVARANTKEVSTPAVGQQRNSWQPPLPADLDMISISSAAAVGALCTGAAWGLLRMASSLRRGSSE